MELITIAFLVVVLIGLVFVYYRLRKIGKGLKELADQLGKHKDYK